MLHAACMVFEDCKQLRRKRKGETRPSLMSQLTYLSVQDADNCSSENSQRLNSFWVLLVLHLRYGTLLVFHSLSNNGSLRLKCSFACIRTYRSLMILAFVLFH